MHRIEGWVVHVSFSSHLSGPAECIFVGDTICTLCLLINAALVVNAEVPEADNIIDQLVECDNILAIFEEAVSPWTTGQAAKVSPAIAPPKPGEAGCSAQAM